MDFDFNLILVPATLIFFFIWLLDKFVLKQRATKGKDEHFLISWAYDFWPVLAVVLVVRSFFYEPFNIPSESMVPGLEVGDFVLVSKSSYGTRLPLVHTKIFGSGEPQHGQVAVFRYPVNPKQSYIKRVIGVGGDTVSMQNGALSINGQAVERKLLDTITQDITLRYRCEDAKVLFPTDTNIQQYDCNSPQVRQQGVPVVHQGIIVERYENTLGQHQFLTHQFAAQQANEMNQRIIDKRDIPITAHQNWTVKVPTGHYLMLGDNRDQSADSREWGFVPEENLVGQAFYIWMHKEAGLNIPSFSRNGSIQ